MKIPKSLFLPNSQLDFKKLKLFCKNIHWAANYRNIPIARNEVLVGVMSSPHVKKFELRHKFVSGKISLKQDGMVVKMHPMKRSN